MKRTIASSVVAMLAALALQPAATPAEPTKAAIGDWVRQYEPAPSAKINGRQNLGENIDDLGGLSIAIAPYRKYVDDKQGCKAPVIDGFTGDQRFFMSWAQLSRDCGIAGYTHVNHTQDRRRP